MKFIPIACFTSCLASNVQAYGINIANLYARASLALSHRYCTHMHLSSNKDLGKDEDIGTDDPIAMQSITDEEALLACRAYLQRKNKLGWKQYHARKQKLKNSLRLSSADEGTGYFWEDPTELKYLFTGRPRLSFEDNNNDPFDDFHDNFDGYGDMFDEYGDDDEDDEEVKDALIIEDDEEEGDTYFTGFPSFPPESFILRSKNKKALFEDQAWKDRWYEARWGNFSKERAQERKTKKIEKYIQQIPSEILRSPELATLSDEDIEDAIRTYILANQKRSISQKKRMARERKIFRRRKDSRTSDNIHEDGSKSMSKSLPTLDEFMSQLDEDAKFTNTNTQEEQQQYRSERAAKAYQTRVKNSRASSATKVSPRRKNSEIKIFHQTGRPRRKLSRVSGAVSRTEDAISQRKYPQEKDIEIILEPNRLAGRKNLLMEVLHQCFGMRGKCIPDLNHLGNQLDDMTRFYEDGSTTLADIDSMDKKFATQSTVHDLGCFICFMVREQQTEG